MARRYDKDVDFFWTAQGDLLLGADGDLLDTVHYKNRAFIQRVTTRLQSRKGDWGLESETGADLTDFAGRPNTRETGAAIEAQVLAELSRGGFIRESDMKIKVFPTGKYSVGAVLQIDSADTGGQVTLTFTVDLRDNKLIAIRNV